MPWFKVQRNGTLINFVRYNPALFYQQGNKQYNINVDLSRYHFTHLTGLFL